MAKTLLQGNTINLAGSFLKAGEKAPDFTLTKNDLSTFSSKDAKGKFLLLNIFPSIDTSVCSASVRKFNVLAAKMNNTEVLCISKDLPFAQARFCAAEGIDHVQPLSDFRTDFGKTYGVLMADGPLSGLLARAVVIVDSNGKVVYSELVPEITQEPNYDAALAALKEAVH
jgi:thiol peroxidase